MNKRILLIPFLALLATSCGGGHITTTPVFETPRAGVLGTPKIRPLVAPTGTPDFVFFNFKITDDFQEGFYLLDGSPWVSGNDQATIRLATSGAGLYFTLWYGNTYRLAWEDYCTNIDAENLTYYPEAYAPFGSYKLDSRPANLSGIFHYKTDYENGYKAGYEQGLDEGREDGTSYASNKLIRNGQYTGLTIFPRRKYLERYAEDVVRGQITPQNGSLDMISTDSYHVVYIKWTYLEDEKAMRFQDYGNTIIGQLDWIEVSEGNWGTSWFGLYDAELHYFTSAKNYAGSGPIDTSFYPEVYLGSTFTGDPNLYFSGSGNGYQMGFADGQRQTIQASETYNNVFTIFSPAFGAVASFLNMNIGPFKVWYFFAIPLIVTLLILVLRLVKH